MKSYLLCLLFLLSSCEWYEQRAIKNWTSDSLDLLITMSKRKSMIHDTPIKTMEAIEAPYKIQLSKEKLCQCTVSLYGGLLTTIANNLNDKSVKSLCQNMQSCYFNSNAPVYFKAYCEYYVEKEMTNELTKNKRDVILRLTKARRKLSSYCYKL